ncbi:GNAT family N-acetyltransferase [Viridibacillus sp. FSL R5-0477]|uniref:Putative acetyltransferase n=1 Tax=Viridibacillus arenosi FSL R5-213 TaxID=1227360 RepID=W4EMG5_9BACL|nr:MULTISPECIES: GNAT family N-acetyltransferase [Viridibacillus]ETT81439.1 putative acetyltransferase [Viridibacillus arenosi FSL R5-213]OMC80080.1 N-acetyltransferase [Viridibacillus sp. FSL H8-0123]OMC84360.1 N-acetyltransferase [Viridibacillus sp. FSL H7-0596]OMC89640.1 N-acetyltransferase [Viridibacillus arenosi]
MQYLKNMNGNEFNEYILDKEKRFAETLAEHTFEVIEPAAVRAKKQLQGYLPNGFLTDQHEFYNIVNENERYGYVWLKIDETKKSAFLYEIYIFDECRSKGIGTKVMEEIEEYLSLKEILYFKLHVFGTNRKAIKLYETIGFQIAGINMYKTL